MIRIENEEYAERVTAERDELKASLEARIVELEAELKDAQENPNPEWKANFEQLFQEKEDLMIKIKAMSQGQDGKKGA